jgi:hypothetical protein
MVYITNGDTVSIDAGESVTWEAHLVTGTPSYTYEWATNKNDTGWSIVSGETGATWIWIPGSGDEGVYDVRCKVTDSSTCTDPGEVIWEEFAVGDSDDDGVQDAEDNCPNHANGPNRGTCTQFDGVNWIVSTKQFCTVDADCDPGEICEKIQADNYPPSGNGIGDACDCESDFLCDGDVDSDDVTAFLDDFGREPSYRRCGHPTWGVCDGDFNCDVDVDADDVTKFIEDFGREASFKPCPPCTSGAWCSYP